MTDEVGELNRRAYSRQGVVDDYVRQSTRGLMPEERVLLDRYRDRIAERRLLDVGVGAGRTAPALSELASEYVAVDYSERAVAFVREQFGIEHAYCQDARSLSFPDESFDVAFFSYNGIDYVSLDDRAQVLRELQRVLTPGGLLLFSSHNLAAIGAHRPGAPQTGKLKEVVRQIVFSPRRLARRRLECRDEGFAVLNDSVHNYALLTCYVDPAFQLRQLGETGFVDAAAFDIDGNPLAGVDRRSPWIHYAATAS